MNGVTSAHGPVRMFSDRPCRRVGPAEKALLPPWYLPHIVPSHLPTCRITALPRSVSRAVSPLSQPSPYCLRAYLVLACRCSMFLFHSLRTSGTFTTTFLRRHRFTPPTHSRCLSHELLSHACPALRRLTMTYSRPFHTNYPRHDPHKTLSDIDLLFSATCVYACPRISSATPTPSPT